jgi:uncharacterized glyoxalase superfamily protein PhnB
MNMQETIQVDVDPDTAFKAFTEEFDQWWGNGPIDSMASWRLVERRIEPGVGGRLVEDFGDEVLVTGTITVWEPGARLAWTTRNDVTIDVAFAAFEAGTRVTVTGIVPDGVDGTAQLSMVRMAPQWFPRHFTRTAPRTDYGRLHVGIGSATPSATARWLVDAFGFEPAADLPTEDGDPDYTWIELRVGSSFVVIWGGGGTPGTDTTIVFVDDLDEHLARAEHHGADIVSPITEHGYRAYVALDCEGRRWQFAQSGPRIGR